LARATYTHVWARNAEGGRGGKTEQKRHMHGNDVIPLREVCFILLLLSKTGGPKCKGRVEVVSTSVRVVYLQSLFLSACNHREIICIHRTSKMIMRREAELGIIMLLRLSAAHRWQCRHTQYKHCP